MENNIYSFIASDAHNISNRNIEMAESIELIKEFNESNLNSFIDNGTKLINNEDIDFKGNKIKSKKSVLSFFKTKK